MVLSPHMLVGATIACQTKNPWTTFGIAVLLHFLFDRLPHWEYHGKLKTTEISKREISLLFLKASVDLAFGSLVIWLFWKESSQLYLVSLGAFAGILPDGIVFLHLLARSIFRWDIRVLKAFYEFHQNVHISESQNSSALGFAAQSLVVILSVLSFFLAPAFPAR